MFIMFMLMMSCALAQWKLIDSSLTNQTLTLNEDGWKLNNVEIGTCNTNGEQQIVLDNSNDLILKSIPIQVQMVQVIFDILFDFPVSDSSLSTVSVNVIQNDGISDQSTLLMQIEKSGNQLLQQSRICRNDILEYPFELKKIVTTKLAVSQKNFSISVQFTPFSVGNKIRIRNFYVYGFFCNSFCKTCYENDPYACTSCFARDTINNNCVCPIINTNYYYFANFYQEGYGCITECSRDHYLSDQNMICQKDLKVSSKLNFMNPLQSLSKIPEIPQSSLSIQTFSQYCFNFTNHRNIAGPFGSQTVLLPLGIFNVISYIRLRITVYMLNFKSESLFKIYLDNSLQFSILLDIDNSFIYTNYCIFNDIAFENIDRCSSLFVDQYSRFELIMYPKTNNPVLEFRGTMRTSSQWGFSNITIDYGVCQLNCQICLDDTTCQVCNEGFFILGNECVNKCPIYSNDCIDYVDEIPFSQYLVKAFYDANMKFDDIQSHFDSVLNHGGNLLTGQSFSMIQDKFVMGGLLVWNNAKYTKSYTITNPHYAISIRFNITFGDDFNGVFNYYLDSIQQNTIDRLKSSDDINLIGKESKESVMFIYQYYQHTMTQFKIEFECISEQDLRDGFCAISEYFIVIHQCVTGCSACTSLDVCTSNINHQVCSAPKFWNYDTITSNYICSDCTLNYCNQCATAIQCKICLDRFSLKHGYCICDETQYRTIVSSMCVCKTGYYENQLTKTCQPICGDVLVVELEECDDGNLYPFDGCNQCKYECQIECTLCIQGVCQLCQEGYINILMQCYPECLFNETQIYPCFNIQHNEILEYQQQASLLISQSICGDFLIDPFSEQCEDGNILPFDGCYICQYSCPDECQTCALGLCLECKEFWGLVDGQCVSVCGNGYVQQNEQCDNGQLDIQLNGCYNCECVKGYIMIDKQCQSICGDGYTTIDEECDDANVIQYDGCNLCILECLNCNICIKGQCQQCQAGYYKDNDQICQDTQCGDNIKVGQEQCDDGNLNDLDGCYQCQCESGWVVNLSNLCSSICGDDLLVKGEQCDDGNNIQFDGCYLCKFDCNVQCTECQLGVCKSCNYGYNLINNNCVNTCGDGILDILKEQCDDQNLISRDGCTNCQLEAGYICFHDNLIFNHCEQCKDFNCQNCVVIDGLQQCKQCQTGYFVDKFYSCTNCDKICIDCITSSKNCINYNYNYYQVKECNSKLGFYYDYQLRDCISQCGDGIISGSENCDDRNLDDFDGCNSKCQIELGYLFDRNNNQLIIEPNVEVQFQSSNNNQYSIIADSQQQAINCSGTTLHIDRFNSTDYNYTIVESDLKCDLDIKYFQNVESFNVIHIIIKYKGQYKKRILDEESVKEVIIIPQRQVYVSEEQKEQGQKMAQTSKTVSQSLLVLGPLAMLIGGFKFVWAILDILSWMNNFYFLNVTYPENVRQIFIQAQWDNILEFPQVNTFNNHNDPYYFQSPIKFYEKGIDPLFFNNIQTILIFLIQVIGTKILCKSIRRILEYCYKTSKCTTQLEINRLQNSFFQLNNQQQQCEIQKQQDIEQLQQNQRLDQQQIDQCLNNQNVIQQQNKKIDQQQIKIPNILKSIYKNCVQFDECFIANLLKTIQLSFLDLTLAITLQITNQQTSHYLIVKLNIIFAYFTIFILGYLLYFSYYISITHQNQLNNKYFNDRYSCFYEQLKTDQRMAMSYSFINLLRKTIFIISTVLFYSVPIYQTTICFLSCVLNIFLLLQQNPFESKEQYFLNLIPDLSVLIVVGISIVLAFQDNFILFSDELIYWLGWVIGGCIYSSIGLQLLFLIKELLVKVIDKVKNAIDYLRKK